MDHKQRLLNGLLRSKGNLENFKRMANTIASEIAYICRNKLEEQNIQHIASYLTLIPIMRAGIGLLSKFELIMGPAETHFIAAKRNGTTFESEILWSTLKNEAQQNTDVILLEPMLATGGTMDKIIDLINKTLVPRSITIASAFSSKEAENRLNGKADIVTFMGDLELNDKKYILIPDPQNHGSYVTLDFGDEFCGTTQ
jgi:uracil phosphoribosyltransferase